MNGGTALQGFWQNAVTVPNPPARAAITYDWWRSFLQGLLDSQAYSWFDRTLELRHPGQGVAGYLARENDENMQLGWRPEPGFLTGAAGVALTLGLLARPSVSRWGTLLLLSNPCWSATADPRRRA